jgi:hypothetical protein
MGQIKSKGKLVIHTKRTNIFPNAVFAILHSTFDNLFAADGKARDITDVLH